MITTTLYGGLGNQMFLYAAVRAASLRNETSMAFNLKQGFLDDKLYRRQLELHHFNLELPVAKISTFDIPLGKYVRFLSRKAGYNVLCPHIKFIVENKMPKTWVCDIKDAYLEGYWAGEKYFADFADVIRKDFTIRQQFITKSLKLELQQVTANGGTPVFIGVRRYQECATVSNIPNGGLGEDANYYRRAMQFIAARVEKPVFWVFSQAQEWFRNNVDDGTFNIVYAEPKKGDDSAIEDMFLMMQCSHSIISYSTYYWWAAWLINNKNKIVICPPSYEQNGSMCKDWICLK